MKFDIKNYRSGKIQFAANIDCGELALTSTKIGLAVKWALKNGVNLYGADLSGADLFGMDLADARLFGTDLSGANMSGANMSGANLLGARLFGSNLSGTNLSGANLSGTDLSETRLFGTNFFGVNLFGAILPGANLFAAKNIFSFGPIMGTSAICYAVNHGDHIMVKLGSFWDTSEKAIAAVAELYGETTVGQAYVAILKSACNLLETAE